MLISGTHRRMVVVPFALIGVVYDKDKVDLGFGRDRCRHSTRDIPVLSIRARL